MKALVLDFDGVISDSAREAFRVALDTYAALLPETKLADVSRADRSELYARFLAIMPLGNRAEDYAVALRALEGDVALADQAAYDAFKSGLDPGWLRSFHQRFYRVRAALSRADPAAWLDLMRPYADLLVLLRRRAGDVELAIATAKDRRSVLTLLRAYGVADLFAADRVLDKETGVSKASHLVHLHGLLGHDYADMTFLDDKVNHLDSVAPLGVRCGLATWGYNGEREERLARERGYLVCTLAGLEEQLFAA